MTASGLNPFLSARRMLQEPQQRDSSAAELLELHLARIGRLNPALKAIARLHERNSAMLISPALPDRPAAAAPAAVKAGRLAAREGLVTAFWTDDPGDFANPGDRVIESRLGRQLRRGGGRVRAGCPDPRRPLHRPEGTTCSRAGAALD